MSRVDTVKRLIRVTEALLKHYQNLHISDNHPRYLHLLNYKLQKFLYVLGDLLEPLRIITKIAQSNDVTIVVMQQTTKLSKEDYKHLHKFLSLILVLPFSSAEAERAFSSMNNIKSPNRNRSKEILKSLMTIYCGDAAEIKQLEESLDELAQHVARNVWQRGRKWASEEYMQMIM